MVAHQTSNSNLEGMCTNIPRFRLFDFVLTIRTAAGVCNSCSSYLFNIDE